MNYPTFIEGFLLQQPSMIFLHSQWRFQQVELLLYNLCGRRAVEISASTGAVLDYPSPTQTYPTEEELKFLTPHDHILPRGTPQRES